VQVEPAVDRPAGSVADVAARGGLHRDPRR
jgi:hypothetical protein